MTTTITLDTLSTVTTAELVAAYNAATGKAIKKFSSRAAGEKQVINALGLERPGLKEAMAANATAQPAQRPAAAPAPSAAPVASPVAEKPTAAPEPRKPAAKSPMQHIAKVVTRETATTEVVALRLKNHHCPLCDAEPGAITPAGAEKTVAGEERRLCHECGQEFWNVTGALFERKKPGRDVGAGIKASWQDPAVRDARSTKNSVLADGVPYGSTQKAFMALGLPLTKCIAFRGKLKAAGSLAFTFGDRTVLFVIVK